MPPTDSLSPPDPDQPPSLRRLAAYAFCYALLFPIGALIGHGANSLGAMLTLPFLALGGWIGGLVAVQALGGWFGESAAYLVGATLGIFMQAYVCVLVWASWRYPFRR